MVAVDELKKIFLMQILTDRMVERISRVTDLRIVDPKESIIQEDQPAKEFMMLKSGKILLRVDASENMTISLGSIKPGFSLGWSALIPGRTYTSSAVCAEKSEIFVAAGEELQEMMEEDHEMGYLLFQGVTEILESRLQRRTGQFLKTLTRHINLEAIL